MVIIEGLIVCKYKFHVFEDMIDIMSIFHIKMVKFITMILKELIIKTMDLGCLIIYRSLRLECECLSLYLKILIDPNNRERNDITQLIIAVQIF